MKNVNEHTLGCGLEVNDFKITQFFPLIKSMINTFNIDKVEQNIISDQLTKNLFYSLYENYM